MSSSSYARKEAGSDVIEYGLLAVVISALLIFIIADPLRITQSLVAAIQAARHALDVS